MTWVYCDMDDAPTGRGWLLEADSGAHAEVMDDHGSFYWIVLDSDYDVVEEGYEASAQLAMDRAAEVLSHE